MSTKLTLYIGERVIEDAKKYAREHGKSLSNLVEEYLKSLTSKRPNNKQEELNALVNELKGSVKMPKGFSSYKDTLEDALIEKYLK